MKKLIKDIKKNRLPKESLHLIKLLDDKNKHEAFYSDMLVRGVDTSRLLFCVTEHNNKIHGYKDNIYTYLVNTFLLFGEINSLDYIINEAIKNSSYDKYERFII